jgi:hypothetical protein
MAPTQLVDVLCDPGMASTVFDCLLLDDGMQVRLASKACAAAVAAHPWAGLRAHASRLDGGTGSVAVSRATAASRLAACFPALRAVTATGSLFRSAASTADAVTDAQLRAFTNLRRLTLTDAVSVTGACFADMPALEELAVASEGTQAAGVTDAALATAARLRRVKLDGPQRLTGAAFKALPLLEEVEVHRNGFMDPALVFYNAREWPRLRRVRVGGCRLMPAATLRALLPPPPAGGSGDKSRNYGDFVWERAASGGSAAAGGGSGRAAAATTMT